MFEECERTHLTSPLFKGKPTNKRTHIRSFRSAKDTRTVAQYRPGLGYAKFPGHTPVVIKMGSFRISLKQYQERKGNAKNAQ